MKKLIILLISLSFIVIQVNAQTFATNDAEWVFDYGALISGITKVKYSKDTIIGQRNVKIFTKEIYRITTKNDTIQNILKPIYIHSLNGVIEYSLNKINFDTLINFNAQIGQSWMIYRHRKGIVSDSFKMTLLDTFRTEISNFKIFTQQIEWTNYHRGKSSFVDTIYDQIGSRWTYIFPFDSFDNGNDGGEGGFLRCFKNDVLGVVPFYSDYQSNFDYDCNDLIYLNNEIHIKTDFALSPNPAQDNVTISFELDKPESISLEIIDVLGVPFTTFIDKGYSAGQHTEEVLLTHLAEGIYYCRFNVGYKNVGVKKLIVVK